MQVCVCVYVCVYAHAQVLWWVCIGKRTIRWRWLSLSTMEISRIELSSSGLAPRAFTHRAILLAQMCSFVKEAAFLESFVETQVAVGVLVVAGPSAL